jgi:signal transduction histidine kinase
MRLGVEVPNAVLTVEDSGIGIAPEDQGRIFERFYRVDKARSRQLGGTGLGLSIVKHVALAHGGNVSLKSTPGRGSTFRVQIPLRRGHSPGAS